MPLENDESREGGKHVDTRATRLMVNSVDKAFRVLSAFDKNHPNLSLVQIAARTGLDLSSVQRFSYTLMELGYLKKNETTRQYALAVRCLDVGSRFLSGSVLVDKATPYMVHLSRETDETINLTMLDNTDVVIVARVLSRNILNTAASIGTSMPAFCTAPGIAILSKLPKDEVSVILGRSKLQAYTTSTKWQIPDILEKIEKATVDGFATVFEEYYYNDASFAAAIIGADGQPSGAINIATPFGHINAKNIGKYSSLVVRAANAMSAT